MFAKAQIKLEQEQEDLSRQCCQQGVQRTVVGPSLSLFLGWIRLETELPQPEVTKTQALCTPVDICCKTREQ